MRIARSHAPRIAAVILSAAFIGAGSAAQIAGGPSPEVRMLGRGPLSDGAYRDAPMRLETKANYGSGVVSVDILRHPISGKVRQMLKKAGDASTAGDHAGAIEQYLHTLAKYPDSAAYVHSRLGTEYIRTEQFAAAAASLEQATQLLPKEAILHHNLGLALVCTGNYDRGVQEVRRALELDPKNETTQALLATLLEHKTSVTYVASQAPHANSR